MVTRGDVCNGDGDEHYREVASKWIQWLSDGPAHVGGSGEVLTSGELQ